MTPFMNPLLVAINAKYTHTNLGVRYLKNALKEEQIPSEFLEFTINQPVRDILTEIAQRKPDILLLSCYIWNIEYVRQIGADFKQLFPQAKVVLGGPEVSYDSELLLEDMPWCDGIISGEGEGVLPQLLKSKDIQGVYYPTSFVDMNRISFPYEDLSVLSNRVLYYESTRGCPFGCSYCLSSAERRVRSRDLSLVFQDLQLFLDAKVMKVKFVDRTFNVDAHRATEIWSYILNHDNGITSFQMELGGDLTTQTQIELLAKARVGLFQFEIGIQSTCETTLETVARATDMKGLKKNIQAIKSGGNIHQHLDLIAGLPLENFTRFGQSFDDVFAMRPEQLQLGFLKILRGSRLYAQRDAFGLVYAKAPPYEILQTPEISFEELAKLKIVEEMTEIYYNTGRYNHQLTRILQQFSSPFALFLALGETMPKRSISKYETHDYLYEFGVNRGVDGEELAWRMRLDICLHEKPKKLPVHCAVGVSHKERKAAFPLKLEGHLYGDIFPLSIVGLEGEGMIPLLFDYENKDPWGHAFMQKQENMAYSQETTAIFHDK